MNNNYAHLLTIVIFALRACFARESITPVSCIEVLQAVWELSCEATKALREALPKIKAHALTQIGALMLIGSLFSGYGGLSLATEQIFDAKVAWHCEFEEAPSKVLEHHWPGVPNLGDITKVDWSTVPPVDIIDGGSPCQDLSAAGRRAGMTDGTRSNLWVNMREAIAQLKPKYVVWENVRGAYSATATSEEDKHAPDCWMEQCQGCVGDGPSGRNLTALGRVLGDLHDLGFDAEWRGLRAADVGAPHGRFRVFVLATRRGA